MNNELIYKQAVINEITEYGSKGAIYISVAELKRRIEHLPPAPQQTGQWIVHENADIIDGYYVSKYECSCCHTWKDDDSNFCPDCGIKMCGAVMKEREQK